MTAPIPSANDRPDLLPEAYAVLGQPPAERIAFLRRGMFIPYPRVEEMHRRLRYILEQPRSTRMKGLTLTGPTNNGKTTLLMDFIERTATDSPSPEAERKSFLYVETPPVPSQTMLFSEILTKLGDPRADCGSAMQKMARVRKLVADLRTRMLIIDEVNNLLAGSTTQIAAVLNTFKFLSSALKIPVLLAGVPAALDVIRRDPQVANRYPAFLLPPWPFDDEYTRLVQLILSGMPLRKRSALSRAAMQRIHGAAEGTFGATVAALQDAAVYAVEAGLEAVTPQALEATVVRQFRGAA